MMMMMITLLMIIMMMMVIITTTMTTTTINGLIKLEPTYNAAVVGLSEYIKQGKNGLTRLMQEYDAG